REQRPPRRWIIDVPVTIHTFRDALEWSHWRYNESKRTSRHSYEATRSFAMFRQKCSRLSVPPNKVVKIVESASRMSPPRVPFGGIQMHELNSRFPAAVNGCGRDKSICCLDRTSIDFVSSVVSA